MPMDDQENGISRFKKSKIKNEHYKGKKEKENNNHYKIVRKCEKLHSRSNF